MTKFNYSLDEYSVGKAFGWGNFTGHVDKAKQTDGWTRAAHILIAAAEVLPIISQIASILEYTIVKCWGDKSESYTMEALATRNFSVLNQESNPIESLNTINFTLNNQRENKIIHYQKGQTAENVPTKKDGCLGHGQFGGVYLHRNHANNVVKKGRNLKNDFEIGNKVNGHELFGKTYDLFIKEYPSQDTKHKLEMEKIDGIELNKLYNNSDFKLNKKHTLSVLESLKSGVNFLYDKNVVWCDVNDGNALITKDGQLKIIDYGYWDIENDPSKKTEEILLGTMELVGWILKSSFVRYQKTDREKEGNIQFPTSIFNDRNALPGQVMSIYKQKFSQDQFMRDLKLNHLKTDEERKAFLMHYLEEVIAEIAKLEEPQYEIRNPQMPFFLNQLNQQNNLQQVHYVENRFNDPNDPNAIFTNRIPPRLAERIGVSVV
jgi:hypothetical protein